MYDFKKEIGRAMNKKSFESMGTFKLGRSMQHSTATQEGLQWFTTDSYFAKQIQLLTNPISLFAERSFRSEDKRESLPNIENLTRLAGSR